jgi:hypothetical protein
MPLDPVIAQGFRGIELQNPLDTYARVQQIQSAQQQNQLNALKMQEYQRENAATNALNQAYQAAYNPATGAYDMNRLRGEVIRGGAGAKLPGIEKQIGELRTQQFAQGKAETELADAKLKQARSFLDTINPADPNAPQQYIAWHEANHRDPVLGPLLASRGVTADQARGRIMQAIQQGPQAFAQLVTQSKLGTEKFIELNKPSTQVIDQSGQRQVVQIPGLGGAPTTVGTYADVPLPAGVEAQKARIAKAGASNISLSTEKKYGEAFAGNIAKVDIDKMTTAESAPALAESANRIIGLVQQGNVLTGPIADVKLNIARALNVAGVDNAEKISNTEKLIAATGQSTLDAIKGAGLGTGQGFTDKDLKFLQGVAGGTINLTPQTLTELASLQHRVATKAAESWNRRRQEIPKDVVQGTGLSMTPITVPPLMQKSAPAAALPKGVGADWTLMADKNGAKAWVSPDRKQIVEVP